MSELDELVRIAGALEPGRVKMLTDIARSLSEDVEKQINPDSDLVTEDFAEAFAARLLIHHGVTQSVMKKRRFEYALKQTAEAVGHEVKLARSSTNPGEDVWIDGTKFSLKTEAAKNISRRKITISKFQEARWIRDCGSPSEFAEGAKKNVGGHLRKYERILMLRAFRLKRDPSRHQPSVRYDLVEIPVEVLMRITDLPASEFQEPSRVNSSGANVVDANGERLFRLTLDGADEKVTIRSLLVDACFEHGSWTAPLSV